MLGVAGAPCATFCGRRPHIPLRPPAPPSKTMSMMTDAKEDAPPAADVAEAGDGDQPGGQAAVEGAAAAATDADAAAADAAAAESAVAEDAEMNEAEASAGEEGEGEEEEDVEGDDADDSGDDEVGDSDDEEDGDDDEESKRSKSDADGDATAKKRKEIDFELPSAPTKVKKARTAYFMFADEKRPEIAEAVS